MPSIFVWKAMNPISSSSIRYYSGSNWFLEEHSTHSFSYLYCQQQTLSQGMVFDAQRMPQNWVGSEIMEIMEVPYQLIREDADGVVEQLGGWMRYRSKCDIPFELDTLEREFQRIINSLDTSSVKLLDKPSARPSLTPSVTPLVRPSTTPLEEPCMIRISSTFVAPPSHSSRNQHHNQHRFNKKPAPLRIAIPSR
jgi:hypothetical protein